MLAEIAFATVVSLNAPTYELDGQTLTVRGADLVYISPLPAAVRSGVETLDEGMLYADPETGNVAWSLDAGDYKVGAYYNTQDDEWETISFDIAVVIEPSTRIERIREAVRAMTTAWFAYLRAVRELSVLDPTREELEGLFEDGG